MEVEETKPSKKRKAESKPESPAKKAKVEEGELFCLLYFFILKQ